MSTTRLPHPAMYRKPRRYRWLAWLVRLPLLFMTGAVLLVGVLLLFLIAFQMRYADRIFPGMAASGADLSGMTLDEATATLEQNFAYADETVFTLRDGERFWQLSAADLGVALDGEATAALAYAVGHQDNLLDRLRGQAEAWFGGQQIAPVITYDQNVAAQRLQTIATEINQAPVSASLVINGAEIQTTPGQAGRTLDIPATLQQLDAALVSMQRGGEMNLVINETAASVGNVEAAASRIRTALSGPVRLTATTIDGNQLGPWTATVEQIAALLRVERVAVGDGTQRYEVDISMAAFERYLETLAPGLLTPPVNARYDFDEVSGTLTPIKPAISGRELDIPATLARLETGVFSAGNRIVPMAFRYTTPTYHNDITPAELGITELVAESTTLFTGSSANRRHNIAISAGRFNGIMIPPGAEFSFNYYLGDISVENGFVEGQVIFGGRTTSGIGGGVCQVSTNAFRAAFTGGFAITERNSHGYRVGYYELGGSQPGLDAAIWQPERDFKFQNNTPHHLLIETSVFPDDNALQFRFYSTKHWKVVIDEAIVKNIEPALPTRYEANADLTAGQTVQVDYAADGADVTVYRDIFDMSGNLVQEDYIYTHYLPWGAIFQVNPNDSRLAQQPLVTPTNLGSQG